MKYIFLIFVLLFLFSSQSFSQSWKELDSIGLEYYNKSDFKTALIYREKGVKQAEIEFGKNDSNYATSLNNLGFIYVVTGQFDKAEPFFSEASKIKKVVLGEKHPNYALSLNNLAELYKELGRYDKAELFHKEALKIRKEILGEKHPDYAQSLNNLAALYDVVGQYDKAEPLFKEALKIEKEVLGEKHSDYAATLVNLALNYFHVGQYDKAEQIYIEAQKIDKEVLGEKHPYYAIDLNNLALLYMVTEKYDKAESLYIETSKINKEVYGEKNINYAISLNSLAILYTETGQFEKAEKLYLKSLEIKKEVLGEKHPTYAISLNYLAVLYQKTGKYDKAEPLFKEALKINKEVLGEKHPGYATNLINLARLFNVMSTYDRAEPLLLEANENYLNQLKTYYPALSENEKVKFLNTIEKNFEFFYSYSIKRISENKEITKNIFDLRIKTKGLILSSTSNVRKRITESYDVELNEKYDKLLSLRAKIGKAYSMSLEKQKKMGINLSELEITANELEKEISLKSEDFKSEIESRSIKYKDIQNCLKQNEAAIEFIDFKYFNKKWIDTIYYYALITRHNLENPVFIKLCNLDELKEYLSGSSEKQNSYEKNKDKSAGLYNLIWKPIEEYIDGIKVVYISPSGILNKVSFALLQENEQTLLIDKYRLKYIGNLKDILKNDEFRIANSELTASVFGGIKYDIDTLNNKNLVSNISRGAEEEWDPPSGMILKNASSTKVAKWSYLPGTLIEADKIKSIFQKNNLKVNEYTGGEATKDVLKSLIYKNSPGVLHISTHGYFFPELQKEYKDDGTNIYVASDNPLFRSGLIFTGANRVWQGGEEIEGVENGILTAYEVSNMDLQNTELVVLSACETGLGDIKGGEGVYGLQRAFKIAGAKTIIMSLWKVPDKETVELMELFYTNWLEKKMTKYEAFDSAQKEMRKKYEPYYWAAFVMIE